MNTLQEIAYEYVFEARTFQPTTEVIHRTNLKHIVKEWLQQKRQESVSGCEHVRGSQNCPWCMTVNAYTDALLEELKDV